MAAEPLISTFVSRGYRFDGGVVHVGSNDGEEATWYIDNGVLPILCFEPHPEAGRRFREKHDVSANSFIRLAPCALGATSGMIALYEPVDGDDEKTSRYEAIPTAGHDWTTVARGRKHVMPVERFDEWCRLNRCDVTRYNVLVIDVQGMELEVLEGFGGLLKNFDFLCVELSAQPMYRGEPAADEVIDWLSARGYEQASDVQEHGDVLFLKRWLA